MPSPLITVAQARELILAEVQPLPAETVAVEDALDRVLAGELRADADVPPFACSAMDGYAVRAGETGRILSVIGESRAGAPTAQEVGDGEAIRISTGAALPPGATAVIPQEQVSVQDSRIEIQSVVRDGQHVRGPGEDMAAGTAVLAAGTVLGAVELGAATAAGAGALTVTRRPAVSVLCTGDELRPPGAPLGPGQIHNSNAPMLTGLAQRAGAAPERAAQLPDDHEATRTAIGEALTRSDVVIVSGGVSVGPHDHVKPALAELGVQEVFWRVALQPGKPTWFGTPAEGGLVFGLPGNPVSAVVTFSLFVAPALGALLGRRSERRIEAQARLGADVRRNPGREQALRVRLQRTDAGTIATPNGAQGSHILTSLIGADALAMVSPGEGVARRGSTVALEELAV